MIWLAVHSSNNSAILASMFVTAPRVFQLLTMLGQFASLIFDWNQVKGRLAILGTFEHSKGNDHKIEHNKIDVLIDGHKIGVSNDEQFTDIVRRRGEGRFLLQGPNGSGKTTLMLSLKHDLADLAFYLPPASDLMFDAEIENGSTGERKLAEIEDVLANAQIKYLLLDEWDANLDRRNVNLINQALKRAAKNICVVEIRHRK